MPGGIRKIRHPAYTQMPLVTPYLVHEPGKTAERRQKMLKPAEGPTTVAILGENPVVGNALESLLRFHRFRRAILPRIPAQFRRAVRRGPGRAHPAGLELQAQRSPHSGYQESPSDGGSAGHRTDHGPQRWPARTHPPTVALRSGGADTKHRSRSAARQRFATLDRIPPATVKPHCHLRIPIDRQGFQAIQGVATGLLARQRLRYVWITYTSVFQV